MAKRPVKKSAAKVEKVETTAKTKKKPWPKCSVAGCKKMSIMMRRLFDGTETHTCASPEHQAIWNKTARDSKPKESASSIAPVKKIKKKVRVKK